jgi:hypothetical protein
MFKFFASDLLHAHFFCMHMQIDDAMYGSLAALANLLADLGNLRTLDKGHFGCPGQCLGFLFVTCSTMWCAPNFEFGHNIWNANLAASH